ncbi:hypothetical protein C8J57DRAFT_1246079 [Mycena rebaudengoi]|nr:hypothetical protein C8J57DRAFT_1246079 [Mycena rebaudengoi]
MTEKAEEFPSTILQIISRFDRTTPGFSRTPPRRAARFPPWPSPGSPVDAPPPRQPPHTTTTATTTPCPPPPGPPKNRTILHVCLRGAAYNPGSGCIARYSTSVTAFASSGAYQVNCWWHALYAEDHEQDVLYSGRTLHLHTASLLHPDLLSLGSSFLKPCLVPRGGLFHARYGVHMLERPCRRGVRPGPYVRFGDAKSGRCLYHAFHVHTGPMRAAARGGKRLRLGRRGYAYVEDGPALSSRGLRRPASSSRTRARSAASLDPAARARYDRGEWGRGAHVVEGASVGESCSGGRGTKPWREGARVRRGHGISAVRGGERARLAPFEGAAWMICGVFGVRPSEKSICGDSPENLARKTRSQLFSLFAYFQATSGTSESEFEIDFVFHHHRQRASVVSLSPLVLAGRRRDQIRFEMSLYCLWTSAAVKRVQLCAAFDKIETVHLALLAVFPVRISFSYVFTRRLGHPKQHPRAASAWVRTGSSRSAALQAGDEGGISIGTSTLSPISSHFLELFFFRPGFVLHGYCIGLLDVASARRYPSPNAAWATR